MTTMVGVAGFTVVQGNFAANAQVSTLALTADVNDADSTYTCSVTPDGGTAQATDVTLNVFAVTPTNLEVKTGTVVTLSCSIEGISKAPTSVVWSKGQVTTMVGVAGFTVVQGNFAANAQVSTLALTADVNDADSTYTCSVTPDGGTAQATDVTLNVFAVTPTNLEVKTSTAVTLSCSIEGISKAPTSVVWSKGQVTTMVGVAGFTVVQGNFAANAQVSTLALTADVNDADSTYTCSVTPDGGTAQATDVTLNVFAVTPTNLEVKTGTAVTLSCSIEGISKAPTSVVWSNGQVTSMVGVAGFTVVQGNFAANAQVSTLALTADVNDADSTYTCSVTPDGGTAQATDVTLNVFAVTPTNLEVKTGTVVTLSCSIEGISKAPTSVVWSKGQVTTMVGVAGFTVVQGNFAANAQVSTLALTADVNDADSTYTCSVTPDGGTAQATDVTLNVFAVTPTNLEVKTGTVVTLSCSIEGISKAPTSVVWSKGQVTTMVGVAGFTVVQGNFAANAQVSTLALTADVNDADSTYTCSVTPDGGTAQATDVTLNVFAVTPTNLEVKTGTVVTLSCSIEGISKAPTSVVWSKGQVTTMVGVAGFTVVQGNFAANAQVSTLALTADVNDADSTYTCSVTPDGGTAQAIDVTLNVFAVTPTNLEVKTGTVVTLSCSIEGISKAPTSVVWSKGQVTTMVGVAGFTVVQGNFAANAQVSTLALTADVNDADSTYTCSVTPDGGTAQATDVTLNVFAVTPTNLEVKTGTVVTLSCSIEGISKAPTSVVWSKGQVTTMVGVAGYTARERNNSTSFYFQVCWGYSKNIQGYICRLGSSSIWGYGACVCAIGIVYISSQGERRHLCVGSKVALDNCETSNPDHCSHLTLGPNNRSWCF